MLLSCWPASVIVRNNSDFHRHAPKMKKTVLETSGRIYFFIKSVVFCQFLKGLRVEK
jgi:hypothetical protein